MQTLQLMILLRCLKIPNCVWLTSQLSEMLLTPCKVQKWSGLQPVDYWESSVLGCKLTIALRIQLLETRLLHLQNWTLIKISKKRKMDKDMTVIKQVQLKMTHSCLGDHWVEVWKRLGASWLLTKWIQVSDRIKILFNRSTWRVRADSLAPSEPLICKPYPLHAKRNLETVC